MKIYTYRTPERFTASIYSIFPMVRHGEGAILMRYPNAKEQRQTLVTSP